MLGVDILKRRLLLVGPFLWLLPIACCWSIVDRSYWLGCTVVLVRRHGFVCGLSFSCCWVFGYKFFGKIVRVCRIGITEFLTCISTFSVLDIGVDIFDGRRCVYFHTFLIKLILPFVVFNSYFFGNGLTFLWLVRLVSRDNDSCITGIFRVLHDRRNIPLLSLRLVSLYLLCLVQRVICGRLTAIHLLLDGRLLNLSDLLLNSTHTLLNKGNLLADKLCLSTSWVWLFGCASHPMQLLWRDNLSFDQVLVLRCFLFACALFFIVTTFLRPSEALLIKFALVCVSGGSTTTLVPRWSLVVIALVCQLNYQFWHRWVRLTTIFDAAMVILVCCGNMVLVDTIWHIVVADVNLVG